MDTKLKITGIIPARYASTRFPGKPLADIAGMSMIERVYRQAAKALEHVVVATDDQRIYDTVKSFGGEVYMTSKAHVSGTDRIAEALDILENIQQEKTDVVINIQGDEPFIAPEQIQLLAGLFRESATEIGSLMRVVQSSEELRNNNLPKVIIDRKGFALYFSRHPLPFQRNFPMEEWLREHTYYRHIGLYGYRADVLREITKLPPSPLEIAESLEQNRWLENGFSIKMAVTKQDSMSVDNPEDVDYILKNKPF